jgi:hypothetical protein
MDNIENNNQEVIEYFKSLGYENSWDTWGGVKYHEFSNAEGKKVMQVDYDIPLRAIKQDLIKERDGIGEGSEYDYIINGGGPEFDELLGKIGGTAMYRWHFENCRNKSEDKTDNNN